MLAVPISSGQIKNCMCISYMLIMRQIRNDKRRLCWRLEARRRAYGIHWPDLDEDLSTDGLLLRGAPAAAGPPACAASATCRNYRFAISTPRVEHNTSRAYTPSPTAGSDSGGAHISEEVIRHLREMRFVADVVLLRESQYAPPRSSLQTDHARRQSGLQAVDLLLQRFR